MEDPVTQSALEHTLSELANAEREIAHLRRELAQSQKELAWYKQMEEHRQRPNSSGPWDTRSSGPWPTSSSSTVNVEANTFRDDRLRELLGIKRDHKKSSK